MSPLVESRREAVLALVQRETAQRPALRRPPRVRFDLDGVARGEFMFASNTVCFRTAGFLDDPDVTDDTTAAVVHHELEHWASLRDHTEHYVAQTAVIMTLMVVPLVGLADYLVPVNGRGIVSSWWSVITGVLLAVTAFVVVQVASKRGEHRADVATAEHVGVDAVVEMLRTSDGHGGRSWTHPTRAQRIAHVQRHAAARGEG